MRTSTIRLACGAVLAPAGVGNMAPLPSSSNLLLVMAGMAGLAIGSGILSLWGLSVCRMGVWHWMQSTLCSVTCFWCMNSWSLILARSPSRLWQDEAAFAGHVAVAADQVGVAVDAIDAVLVGQVVA